MTGTRAGNHLTGLDTQLSDVYMEGIARVMDESGLTVEELWRVYSYMEEAGCHRPEAQG